MRLKCSGRARSLARRMPPVTMSAAPEHESRDERLVEEHERRCHGEQRCRPDRHRGARSTCIAHREGEQDLRDARRQEPGEDERPRVCEVPVAACDRDDRRHQARGHDGEQAPDLGRDTRPQRNPDEHRHRTEEERRQPAEHDRRHAAATPRRDNLRNVAAAAGSATSSPAIITPQPSHPPSRGSRRPAERRRVRRTAPRG